jgi:hypothetical protein
MNHEFVEAGFIYRDPSYLNDLPDDHPMKIKYLNMIGLCKDEKIIKFEE